MRLAVLSDIHGNLPALEAVLNDVQRRAVDEIVVLGDLADRTPFPLDVVQRVTETNCTVVRGNTDTHLLRMASGDAPEAWHSSLQFAPLRWTLSHLNLDALDFIAGLPDEVEVIGPDGTKMRFVHGSPDNASEGIYPRLLRRRFHEIVDELTESLLFCGHTHRPWFERSDGKQIVNPGSVGQPFNNSNDAHYALVEWSNDKWHIQHRQVSYDVETVSSAFETSGYVSEGGPFARASHLSICSGRDAMMPFLRYAHYLAQAPQDHFAVISDETLLEAEATWHWRSGTILG